MNLDRTLPIFVILCVSIGALIGYLRGNSAVTGAEIGLAVGFSPLLLLAIGCAFFTLWCPDRPTCMCGKYKSIDYKHLSHLSKRKRDVYYYKCCNCGREYRLQNKHFDLRLSENDFQSYMMISKWGRWRRSTKLDAPGDSI